MMQIFNIDWQQHWKYNRTMNIGANVHDKRAVPTKQPQVTDLTSVDSWASSDIGEVLSKFYKSLDCFTMRLFHSATIFCCYICTCICCLKLHQADYQVGEVFLPQFWWGALRSNVFTICAVYWSLGRRGYFGVSNVVLVIYFVANTDQFVRLTMWKIEIKGFRSHSLNAFEYISLFMGYV